jgi:tetratricopeptide (TPR) repeat protein
MTRTLQATAAILATLAQLATLPAARAADISPAPAPAAQPAASPLAAAQGHLKAQRWAAAVEELKRINASADADWNNLMGYALRKLAKPDLDGAQRHYDAALRINPNHQGALEYAGELALMKRDPATAEAYLARLQKLCTSPCEPLDDLRQAIAKYKAANKG